MKVACDGWYDQFARAPANRASSQCHEIRLDSLLESYSCRGRVAQLGEHLLCKQGVTGSIPVTSTNFQAKRSVFWDTAPGAVASVTSVSPPKGVRFRERAPCTLENRSNSTKITVSPSHSLAWRFARWTATTISSRYFPTGLPSGERRSTAARTPSASWKNWPNKPGTKCG